MKYKHAIIFILLIISIGLTGCFLFPPTNNTAEWTVMIYLDSDNNLESAGIDDINEMEMVGSTTDVNIVVQVDRIPYSVLAANNQGYADDVSNGDWTNTRRYYITQDFDPYLINISQDFYGYLEIVAFNDINPSNKVTIVNKSLESIYFEKAHVNCEIIYQYPELIFSSDDTFFSFQFTNAINNTFAFSNEKVDV